MAAGVIRRSEVRSPINTSRDSAGVVGRTPICHRVSSFTIVVNTGYILIYEQLKWDDWIFQSWDDEQEVGTNGKIAVMRRRAGEDVLLSRR